MLAVFLGFQTSSLPFCQVLRLVRQRPHQVGQLPAIEEAPTAGCGSAGLAIAILQWPKKTKLGVA